MISICRKLSRGWNNFELMVSICRKLSRGRHQKKKVPALAQLFQPPTNCNPNFVELEVFYSGFVSFPYRGFLHHLLDGRCHLSICLRAIGYV